MTINNPESNAQFLSGGGEMGKLIRCMDWSKTALGPVETWPQSLRTSVSLCLSSTFPILIAWGPETIQIYNDSYRPICGAKHPESMGQNFRICWETALPVVGDKFTRGQQGEGTYITDQRMFLDRYGYLEESWMTFSFAPIRDESGGVGGIFHPITETTEKMLSGRRTQVLRDLGAAIGKTKSVHEIGELTNALYEQFELDIPFLLFYEYKDEGAELISAAGTPANSLLADGQRWPLQAVKESGEMLIVENLQNQFGDFKCGPYDLPPHTALVLPVRITGQEEPFGVMVAGVSACRALDHTYQNFYEQLAATYNTAVSNVYAYEQEQKRAEALAAIDRSKTAFFSNVSHEFRTPLTLMLGPLEDLLSQQHLDAKSLAQVEATHRNALRLFKLVNNLLDFSRVEAGRAQAAYEPLDLAELTTDLASSFRSIIEKAGMQLRVSCTPLIDTYYADRQMWEKIVLNLLSNAFKYTLEGDITVSLEQSGGQAVLKVSDTGIGIPEKELPHMFERFHRVANSAGRTHEGTGIGLSLVNELVHLHGGNITVDSIEGKGSTFTVTLPAGKMHLPQDHVVTQTLHAPASGVKQAFIKEAYSLLEETDNSNPQTAGDMTVAVDHSVDKGTHILVVDDNADMRAYLKRLLDPYFTVHLAANGKEALKHIDQQLPALVISDIMMPVMDGKALLAQLRNNEPTMRLPVIFLSARAGEEARIDGLEAGADDYLVKPFSAAELLTKVRAQIHISQARGQAEQQLRRLLADAPVAIAVYRGADHVVELANQRMLAYWDKQADEILYQPVFSVMTELGAQGFKNIMDKVYQSGEQVAVTEAMAQLQRDGQPITAYLNLTIEPLRDETGKVTGTITVAADVTEQVSARKLVEQVNNTLQLAVNAAQMGIWRMEWGTDHLQLSETARLIHGLSVQGALSFDKTTQLIIPEHRGRVLEAISQAVNTRGTFNEDYQITLPGTTELRWLNTTGMTEINDSGEILSVVGTIIDITESKTDAARKDDFISMVSHELKTPLTSISGFTQMGLMQAKKQEDMFQASLHEKILKQVRKMSTLINGFLNVSRLDSGKIQLTPSRFFMRELVDELIAEFTLTAGEVELIVEGAAPSILADRDKISTVLSNFIGNALKYAPQGKAITVTIHETETGVQVSVRDEGPGISAVNLGKLFERYYRVENKENVNIAGFGIGLYLSAEIIRRHGGKIWAESEPGNGATFYFTLPNSSA